jgi:hypothetical protein
VADDDDLVSATGDRGSDGVGSRAGREPVVGLGGDVERSRELTARLAGAEQRARQDRSGARSVRVELLAQRPSLLASLRSQPTQLVGLSGRGLGVADEVQAHLAEDSLAAWQ